MEDPDPCEIVIELRKERVTVRLVGKLTEVTAHNLLQRLRKKAPPGVQKFLIDLRGLTGCTILGRSGLIKVQGLLSDRRARTSYLADSPRFRGTGLWVAHEAHDEGANVFADEAAASEWLELTVGRQEQRNNRLKSWGRS